MILKKKKTKASMNPTLAGVAIAGAVVGAGMVAATTVLKDKKNQKKMKAAFDTVTKKAKDYLEEAQSHLPPEKQAKIEKKVTQVEEKVKKVASKIEKKTEKKSGE